jgi:diacylglycerol diphosphate phosphatase/phosphatidate phosphatase
MWLTCVVSFAGLFYLSLYLAAKLHVLDSKGEVWKSFLVLVPCIAAALIAGSRIMDARHHPFDVLSGSLMGILVAWGAYRQYFPPLHETWRKGRAYPIRSWGREPVKPPMAQVDEDVQPLTLARAPTDEERAAASGFSSAPAAVGSDEHGGNVFRQQISQSQRRRQQDGSFAPDRADTLTSNYSTTSAGYRGQLPGPSPFANGPRPNGPRRNDTYDYSSSEDDGSYELQQTYTLSNPQGGSYNPVSGTLTDTGYHPPPGARPGPTPPPPHSEIPRQHTGDLGDRSIAGQAPPPHAAGTAVQQV